MRETAAARERNILFLAAVVGEDDVPARVTDTAPPEKTASGGLVWSEPTTTWDVNDLGPKPWWRAQYYYRARWYLPEGGVLGERDPVGYVFSPSLYNPLLFSGYNIVDTLGLAPKYKGYNMKTGVQAHKIFTEWMGRTVWAVRRHPYVFLDKSLSAALDVDCVLWRRWRPDVMYVPPPGDGEKGVYFELKPITHLWEPDLGLRDLNQLKRYDRALNPRVVAQWYGHALFESVPNWQPGMAVPLPGFVLDLDDTIYSISIQPADAELFYGLVYYELHDTGEDQTMFDDLKDLARRFSKTIPELPPEAWWRLLPPFGPGWVPFPA
jgi:hypothetical protein